MQLQRVNSICLNTLEIVYIVLQSCGQEISDSLYAIRGMSFLLI